MNTAAPSSSSIARHNTVTSKKPLSSSSSKSVSNTSTNSNTTILLPLGSGHQNNNTAYTALLLSQNKQLSKYLKTLQSDFDLLSEYVSHVENVLQQSKPSMATSTLIQKMRDLKCTQEEEQKTIGNHCHLSPDLEAILLDTFKNIQSTKFLFETVQKTVPVTSSRCASASTKQNSHIQQQQETENTCKTAKHSRSQSSLSSSSTGTLLTNDIHDSIDKTLASIDFSLNALGHFTIPNTLKPAFHLPKEFKTQHPTLPSFESTIKSLPPLSTKQKSSIEELLTELISTFVNEIQLIETEKSNFEKELIRIQQSYRRYIKTADKTDKEYTLKRQADVKHLKTHLIQMISALEKLGNGFTKQSMIEFVECVEVSLNQMFTEIQSIEKSIL